ncbi:hypothetical protein LAUMK35_05672 [Mycobacterium pseudokansasii]|nr:hypothetical protein LAUMK35_05672 [Mycobacterium pseudokansasii]VBA35662.1 hypothetical protein LAUMK21_05651 [Mycobacterium pseudokansasii]
MRRISHFEPFQVQSIDGFEELSKGGGVDGVGLEGDGSVERGSGAGEAVDIGQAAVVVVDQGSLFGLQAVQCGGDGFGGDDA